MEKSRAREILQSMTKGDSLLRHARTVELVMEAYAEKLGEDVLEWGNTGLLHDADYEAYPEEHPDRIVSLLREEGEEQMAHAISAHYTKWGVPYNTPLDKALIACDEITGFVVACCQVRPEGIATLTPKSVKKKLKQKSFAASVDRNEIEQGLALFEVSLDDHLLLIIEVLKANREELQI